MTAPDLAQSEPRTGNALPGRRRGRAAGAPDLLTDLVRGVEDPAIET